MVAGAPGKAEDEALVAKAAQGDAEAFETLVLRYQDRVYSLLCRLSGSEEDAEDLAQETFMKAYRALGSFRQGSQFYTWLFRIAVNTSYSRGRQVQRRRKHEGVSLDAQHGDGEDGRALGETAAAPAEAPEARMEKEHVRQRVRDGIAQLDSDYRAVLLLRDMDGLDYDAIAETLEITRAAVKSRLHRARLELARILKDLKPEGSANV
ncbi:MAG: sigma-70 family RNA polymerase sigma factor [Planctomycetota bacterium]|nr:sigma-70 family RNA polymerase sigma factor [Planctomycetota bacterium]